MKEYYGNILDLIGKTNAICITTNMFVKANGRAVMGRGIAKAIKDIIPDIDTKLGSCIKNGMTVGIIDSLNSTHIVSFPVKPANLRVESKEDIERLVVNHMQDKFKPNDTVPGWACKAMPTLILASCIRLKALADNLRWTEVYLPRPGCGAGELDYNIIKPILEGALDDRFNVSTFRR